MFATTNPFNNQLIQQFPSLDSKTLADRLSIAQNSFTGFWSTLPLSERAKAIRRIGEGLRSQKSALAALITLEMGKRAVEAEGEIEKCAWLCDYMADQAESFLADRLVETDYQKSFVHFQPIGAVLGIMPWNFPFWQAFRYAIPAALAGNVILLKPAPNVPQCGMAIQKLFQEAIGEQGVFQTLLLEVDRVEEAIAHPVVQGIAVTGSDRAGSAVAALAGKHLKKCVLELGGSDPFIVLEDADLEKAVTTGIKSRMFNCGQTCIAAKRFIVHDTVFPVFRDMLVERVRHLKLGAPGVPDTGLSVMARPDLVANLDQQVNQSIALGAKSLIGGGPIDRPGNFFQPVILTEINPGMPAYQEELFGPVIALFSVKDEAAALQLANDSQYGLGASVWSEDPHRAEGLARSLQVGAVAINDMVKSDPRLPFGGVKRSGFGRELGLEGMREFVNIQSIVWQ